MYHLSTIPFLLLLYAVKSERNVWLGIPTSSPKQDYHHKPNINETLTCSQDSQCSAITNSFCFQGTCNCSFGYYQYNSTACVECPRLGEDCSTTSCCYSTSTFLTCNRGVCECMENFNGMLCWDDDSTQRLRFQKVAQFILAIGLIFTTVIIVILFWKACSNGVHHPLPHVDSIVSLNSIQRLVLLRLQDRPPTYNQIYQPTKRQSRRAEIITATAPPYEEPPPYSEVTPGNHSYENVIFFINEQAPTENPVTNTTGNLPRTSEITTEHKPELHI
uniref:EGF-like domain-containing protein n=1 Tax=Clastoptera arizonana TaxID=38151 RepID=A0A1B6C5Q0_9HEMI